MFDAKLFFHGLNSFVNLSNSFMRAPSCFWGICGIQVCLALSSCWWSDSTLTLCLFSTSVQEILLCFLFEEFLVLPGEYLNNNFIKYIIFALCIWLFVNASFIHIICLIHQSLTQLYNWSVRFVQCTCILLNLAFQNLSVNIHIILCFT